MRNIFPKGKNIFLALCKGDKYKRDDNEYTVHNLICELIDYLDSDEFSGPKEKRRLIFLIDDFYYYNMTQEDISFLHYLYGINDKRIIFIISSFPTIINNENDPIIAFQKFKDHCYENIYIPNEFEYIMQKMMLEKNDLGKNQLEEIWNNTQNILSQFNGNNFNFKDLQKEYFIKYYPFIYPHLFLVELMLFCFVKNPFYLFSSF